MSTMPSLSTRPPTPDAGLVWWLPRIAFALFITALFALLWLGETNERDKQRATLISDMLWLEQNMQFLLNHNEELLSRFDFKRIQLTDVFEAHANTLIARDTGITRVLWLDADDRLYHALPTTNNMGELAVPASDLPRLAHSLGRPVYSQIVATNQNDALFAVFVPVFQGKRKIGTSVGVYSLRRLLEQSVPWWLAERYSVSFIDAAGQTLATRSRIDAVVRDAGYQIPLDPPGDGLALSGTPYEAPTALVDRIITIALIVLAILALFSLWRLRRHVQRRLAAEEALHNEVAFRKAMEDSVQTGLRARALDGRVTYANPAFCRMVGWPAEELVGKLPPMPYWSDEHIEETRDMMDRILSGQAPREGFEMRFRRRNGEVFDALIHEAPLIDGHGKHTGWMSSVVDITERKRNTELARQQEERLQASARLITMGEMASSLAHELNQPLSAISSYTSGCRNLIAENAPLDQIDEALAKCQQQAQRAGRIIRRIYEFARRHEPKTEACDVGNLIADMMVLVEADARRRKTQVIADIAPQLPVIHADPVLLGQALLNLMRNGIEAMAEIEPTARTLAIGARFVEGHILITVADRGCGIPDEVAAHLFEPFFTTKQEGLGVGLNICRSVVEAHRGRLWFEPNPDGGTVFRLILPEDVR